MGRPKTSPRLTHFDPVPKRQVERETCKYLKKNNEIKVLTVGFDSFFAKGC